MENKKIDNKIKTNTKKYEQYLDSDDEFPFEYNEIPSFPVYKNDNRFDKIIFKWINNQESHNLKTDVPVKITKDEDTKDILSNNDNRLIITNGVLSKNDLFCLKSIEECACDSTFMWLLNFLISKDAQSRYMFLKSCLVSTKLCNDIYYSITKTNSLFPTKKMYKLLVKM